MPGASSIRIPIGERNGPYSLRQKIAHVEVIGQAGGTSESLLRFISAIEQFHEVTTHGPEWLVVPDGVLR